MEVALWVFNLFNTFVIFDYFRRTYGFKYERRGINCMAIAVFYFVHTLVNLRHIVAMNIVSEFLLMNLFGFLFFKPKKGKFYFNAIFQFYLLSLDLIFTCASSLIHCHIFTQMQVEAIYIPYVAVNFLLLFLTYKKIIGLFQHEFIFLYLTKWKIIVSSAMIFQFALVIFISLYLDVYIANITGMIVMFYISFFNAGSLFLFLYAQKTYETQEKAKLYEMQNMALYDSLILKDTSVKAITDIVYTHLAREKMPETQAEMDAHLKKIQEKLSRFQRYECGNEAINAIVNNLIWRCELAQIKLKENIEAINWDFIDKVDIMMILGSLLNNSLEISGRIQEIKRRNIQIVVRRKRDFALIKIVNTCNPALVRYDDENKKAFQNGSKTIRVRTTQAVEFCLRNHGTINFALKENLFIVTVHLPMINFER